MKQFWLLVGVVIAIFDFTISQDSSGRILYSSRYDNLDISSILTSKRLVTNYVDCLVNEKPCPPEGKDLKRILPEALRTKCSRCTPNQKEMALKIIRRLYEEFPVQYEKLRAKWDQTGEYHRRFEQYLREEQFNTINNSNQKPTHFQRPDSNQEQSQVNIQRISPTKQTRVTQGPIVNSVRSNILPSTPTVNRSLLQPITVPTPKTSTQPPSTQRPDRSPTINSQNINQNNLNSQRTTQKTTTTTEEFRIGNRFSDDADDVVETSNNDQNIYVNVNTELDETETTKRTVSKSNSQNNDFTPQNGIPPNIIDNFFVPPKSSCVTNQQNLIQGILNSIGTKITNTAEILTGMLHSTVRVFVGGGVIVE